MKERERKCAITFCANNNFYKLFNIFAKSKFKVCLKFCYNRPQVALKQTVCSPRRARSATATLSSRCPPAEIASYVEGPDAGLCAAIAPAGFGRDVATDKLRKSVKQSKGKHTFVEFFLAAFPRCDIMCKYALLQNAKISNSTNSSCNYWFELEW